MRKISGLRRRAVVTAAMAAVLGGVPAVGLERGHLWVMFVCVALQVILLTMAISYLVRAKRSGDSARSPAPKPRALTDLPQ